MHLEIQRKVHLTERYKLGYLAYRKIKYLMTLFYHREAEQHHHLMLTAVGDQSWYNQMASLLSQVQMATMDLLTRVESEMGMGKREQGQI